MTEGKILQEGRNCWRIARANRAAFLIDAASYFSVLKTAFEQARQFVLILAWDIDSRLELVRNAQDKGRTQPLVNLLNELASKKKGLHIYVLAWDFAMIYALEREWLPIYKLGWRTHRHVKFRMDGNHPLGASHHQKVVVVDDALAFAGGIDPCKARWDTPEHRPNEPRRVDPDGQAYPPFHDVQMIVDGEAAAALGSLARARWLRATGRDIPSPVPKPDDHWPEQVNPDFERIDVGVSLTQPAHEGMPESRQIERLYLDAIERARKTIYIENQYFTSNTIGEALARRLREKNGPEITMVLPQMTSGWLEQNTMDVLRYRLLKRLREADRHGRLRVYYPHIPGLGEDCLNVHAKVFVVDDHLVRVGSSNLSNRSMGFDTECDLAIEAGENKDFQKKISGFRNRLLGEHLGVPPETVADQLQTDGSLITSIEALRGNTRTFRDLDERVPETIDNQVPESAVIDPERPIDPERLVERFIPREHLKPAFHRGLRLALLLSAVVLLTAIWFLTPLGEWFHMGRMSGWLEAARQTSIGPVGVIALFLVGSLVAVPVTLMLVGTLLVFGPIEGSVYAWSGCLVAAATGYEVGRVMGRDLVRQYGGDRINKLSQWMARRGVRTIATLRIVPVAPFTVINMVAGASHIRFKDYILGTVLGLTPGLLAFAVGLDRLIQTARDPGPGTFLMLAGVLLLIGSGAWLLWRWSLKRVNQPQGIGIRRSH